MKEVLKEILQFSNISSDCNFFVRLKKILIISKKILSTNLTNIDFENIFKKFLFIRNGLRHDRCVYKVHKNVFMQ